MLRTTRSASGGAQLSVPSRYPTYTMPMRSRTIRPTFDMMNAYMMVVGMRNDRNMSNMPRFSRQSIFDAMNAR